MKYVVPNKTYLNYVHMQEIMQNKTRNMVRSGII